MRETLQKTRDAMVKHVTETNDSFESLWSEVVITALTHSLFLPEWIWCYELHHLGIGRFWHHYLTQWPLMTDHSRLPWRNMSSCFETMWIVKALYKEMWPELKWKWTYWEESWELNTLDKLFHITVESVLQEWASADSQTGKFIHIVRLKPRQK